jgi:predicted Zn-ribbon and HTH transcriptional regulator
MIEITPETACVLYLGLAISALIIAWFFHQKKTVKKEVITFQKSHFTCEFCHFTFVDDPVKALVRCPECHSLNKNIKEKHHTKKK